MADDGTFNQYDPVICRLIEEEFQQGKSKVTVLTKGTKYDVTFGEPHEQRLKGSQVTRVVRRVDGSCNVATSLEGQNYI